MEKFLFDTHNFDPKHKEKPVFSQEEVAQATQQARDEGRAAGIEETTQRQEEAIAAALADIGKKVGTLAKKDEQREVGQTAAAVRIAMRIAHKLLPRFAEEHGLAEIERAVVESFEVRRDEPRIAVTVPAQHLEALRERIDALALEKGFAGNVILIGDDGLRPSDCRVEWADGGAERLYERLFAQIENECAKAIAGMDTVIAEAGENTEDKT